MFLGLKRMEKKKKEWESVFVERADGTLGESQGPSRSENQDSGKAVKGQDENCNSQYF